MNVITEEKLEEAFEHIESAVWIMAKPNEELMINDKTRAIEKIFNNLMLQFDLEEVK